MFNNFTLTSCVVDDGLNPTEGGEKGNKDRREEGMEEGKESGTKEGKERGRDGGREREWDKVDRRVKKGGREENRKKEKGAMWLGAIM